MTVKHIRISRKLHIITRFFIHRRNYKNCPQALIQLHDLFGENLKTIFEKSDNKPNLKACQEMAQMIDKALETSAEITLRSRKEHRKCLDRFKTRLWVLLEILDKYSQLFYEVSVW